MITERLVDTRLVDTVRSAETKAADEQATHADDTVTELSQRSSSDEEDLAATLAAVLARKPRRHPTQPVVPSTGTGADDETAAVSPTARRRFVSALRSHASTMPGRAGFPDEEDTGVAETRAPSGASWVAASRHRKLRRNLKTVSAWIVTVVIGSAIVVIAAVMLFEGPRNLEAWLDLAYRTL